MSTFKNNVIRVMDGFSGCEIILCKNSLNGYFIRKKSRSVSYNSRLELQIEKQKGLGNMLGDMVKVPKIFSRGYSGKLLFYDMEYIKGKTAINFIRTAPDKNIIDVISKIVALIIRFSVEPKIMNKNNSKPYSIFVEAVFSKTNSILCSLEIDNDLKRRIYYSLEKIISYNYVNETFCHGDFTLENIIIDGNKDIWLIDFLDCFFSHYWFDIAKVYQDLEGEWFRIKNPDFKVPLFKMYSAKNTFDNLIDQNFSDYKKIHYFLLTLNFLRILPYIKEDNITRSILPLISEYTQKFLGQ